jgi:hypothetical protein
MSECLKGQAEDAAGFVPMVTPDKPFYKNAKTKN